MRDYNLGCRLLRPLGIEVVPHGVRSSFRNWAGELLGASHEAMERALVHSIHTKLKPGNRPTRKESPSRAMCTLRRRTTTTKSRNLHFAFTFRGKPHGLLVAFAKTNKELGA